MIGGPIALFNWFVDLPIATQVPVALGVAGVLALIGYLLWSAWSERQRKKQEYQQALLDFRWRENMSPIDFERCCADYLGLTGWDARTTKGSGDQGADVIARKANHLLVVQCKKYQKPVGNKAVQEVIAARAYQRATAAAVVSNQTYTRAARELAEKAGVLLLHFTDLRNVDRLLGLPQQLRGGAGGRVEPRGG
ncbi:MAG: restriction endonuclease [Acetobacteraceae bacterium]